VTQTWTDRERRMLEAIRDGEEAGEELELTMLAERVRLTLTTRSGTCV
jgi:hypothetical protein